MLWAKNLEESINRLELYPRLTNSQLAEDIINVLIELKMQRKTIEILKKELLESHKKSKCKIESEEKTNE